MKKPKAAPHPGQYIEQLLRGYEINQTQLGNHIGCDPALLNRIIRERQALSPQAAIWMEQVFGVSAQFWMHVQAMHSLRQWKAANPRTHVARLKPPNNFHVPSCFDRCLCGHWGWHHQDYPKGPCLEEFCECEAYRNLGDVVKKTTKELGYTEEIEKWR